MPGKIIMKQSPINLLTSITLTVLLILTTGVLAQTPASKQSLSIPDTPAGRRLTEWLRLYKAGDFDAIRNFMTASYAKPILEQASADYRASYLVPARFTNGELKIIAIEKSSDNELVALLESELTQLQWRLTTRLAPEEPHIITAIGLASF